LKTRIKVSLTRGQVETLQALMDTQVMTSEAPNDISRYEAIARACQKALLDSAPKTRTDVWGHVVALESKKPKRKSNTPKKPKRKSHYCMHCALDMAPDEERECRDCDGDLCEPRAYLRLRDLKADHPRVVAEAAVFARGGCRHRPKCTALKQHLGRSRS
jgi:hypothetical protein